MTAVPVQPRFDQSHYLSILTSGPPADVKEFVEDIIPEFGQIEVLQNRTGLVMLPMTENAQGTTFYVGEVLVAEARVRLQGAEGYAACIGRDLQQALAIALLDAAMSAGIASTRIMNFVAALEIQLDASDQELLRQVESTRVEMETF